MDETEHTQENFQAPAEGSSLSPQTPQEDASGGSAPSDPDAPLTRRELQELLQEKDEQWSGRMKELELENARLRGMQEAGGARQQAEPEPTYATETEYQLALKALEATAQTVEQDSPEFAQLRDEFVRLKNDYQTRFLPRQKSSQESAQQRRIDRASFLATRKLDPESEEARFVETLHENGVPLERIEHLVLSPRDELSQLRGQRSAQDQQTGQVSRATEIEEGVTRTSQPHPVTGEKLTGDQFAQQDLVERYENSLMDLDEQVWGSTE